MTNKRARELFGAAGTPRIAIIGCGFSGLAVAVNLKKAGIHTFTIFERSDGPGGTWWDNRYPGVDVDIPSILYSFSFKDYNWSRTHANRAEMLEYVNEIIDDFELRPHIRFGTSVDEAVWDDSTHLYTLRTAAGDVMAFNVVVSAVGLFNTPRIPNLPGLDQFMGPAFHTFRWEDHDLAGKRVAVVGTGSTGTQLVSAIAPVVGKLYVFQREPGWMFPKGLRELTVQERAAFHRRLRRRIQRFKLFIESEWPQIGRKRIIIGSKTNRRGEKNARAFINRALAGRPDLIEAVTPKYPFMGKRPVKSDTFYETLKRDNVEFVPRAVAGLTATSIVDTDGVEREIDILIFATGFKTADYLGTLRVVGRSGQTIHEAWNGEPQGFLGITVADFPNFYMMYGPNTNAANSIPYFEVQAAHVVRHVKRMISRGVTSIEVNKRVMDRYNDWLQSRLEGTALAVSRNYYKSSSGRVVTQWPDGVLFYGLLAKVLDRLPGVNQYRRRAGAWDPDAVALAPDLPGVSPATMRTKPRREAREINL